VDMNSSIEWKESFNREDFNSLLLNTNFPLILSALEPYCKPVSHIYHTSVKRSVLQYYTCKCSFLCMLRWRMSKRVAIRSLYLNKTCHL
jgi:hypothetical protein